jgi:predicted RNase H-related nuclease YkuK (DUF458 family)
MGGITINTLAEDVWYSSLRFRSSKYHNLTFGQVYNHIIQFIREAPYYEYRLSIGTDSQVRTRTFFVTAIHLHRIGRGAIGFITTNSIPRAIKSLREKIYYETSKTLEIASLFTPQKIDEIIDCILDCPGRHGEIHFEFHLDIGVNGPTRELINEMIAMAKGTVFEPKIKPQSYAASSYADRYTK